jgi:hypothetical protein
MTGHIDVAGRLAIADWKSGWVDRDHTPQTMSYAWLTWACAGRSTTFTIVTYTVWLRMRKIDKETYDTSDMMSFEETYLQKLSEIGKTFNPGDACLYCARKHECAAHREWLATSHAMILADRNQLVSREQLARAYPVLKELQFALDQVYDMIRAEVEKAPLMLEPGYELRIVGGECTVIEAEAGWPVLSEYLSPEALSACVSIRKGNTIKAVREATPKGEKKKDREKAFLKALAEAGALAKVPTAGQMRKVKCKEEVTQCGY